MNIFEKIQKYFDRITNKSFYKKNNTYPWF